MSTAFPRQERRLLLATPGIGKTVVQRLEAAGFASLQALCDAGATRATEQVTAHLGGLAWRNRRRAIERAIADALRHAGTCSSTPANPASPPTADTHDTCPCPLPNRAACRPDRARNGA